MASAKKSYYDILGVDRNASDKEIQSAMRARAKELHPDRLANLSPKERTEKAEMMYSVNEA